METVRMTMEDVDAVTEIDRRCFEIPWSKNAFTDEMNNQLAVYFVVKDEGKCVGYCGLWNVAGEGDITNIAVLPEYRRRGIGSILLETLIRHASGLHLSLLTLEVRAGNKPAQALYAKYGFKRIGARKRYYSNNGEDAWIMTKEL